MCFPLSLFLTAPGILGRGVHLEETAVEKGSGEWRCDSDPLKETHTCFR